MKKNFYIFYIVAMVWVFFSYFIFFFIKDTNIINLLSKEDGIFEYLGAAFFLLSAIIFFKNFFFKDENIDGFFVYKQKNIFFLLLGILFLFVFFEEISWGQRLFGVSTPQFLQDVNLQKEINIHNLEIMRIEIPGMSRIIDLNMLFQIFWFTFCCLTPILYKYSNITRKFINKINLPVGPVIIGFLFIYNYVLSRIIQLFNFSFDLSQFIVEIKESNAALIFMLLSIWFLRSNQKPINNPENVVKETL